MFEREYRELSFVRRWGIHRRLLEQSVAEHSYYVALYAMQIAKFIGWPQNYSGTVGELGGLLRAALLHDVPEVITGDPAGPVKRQTMAMMGERAIGEGVARRFGPEVAIEIEAANHPTSNAGKEIKAIVKVADSLDALFHLATEIQMGNQNAAFLVEQERRRLQGYVEHLEQVLNYDSFYLRQAIYDALVSHERAPSKVPDEDKL